MKSKMPLLKKVFASLASDWTGSANFVALPLLNAVSQSDAYASGRTMNATN